MAQRAFKEIKYFSFDSDRFLYTSIALMYIEAFFISLIIIDS